MILVDGVMTLMIMIVVDYNDDDDDEIRMPHYARECQAANIALSSERSPLLHPMLPLIYKQFSQTCKLLRLAQ